MNWVITVENRTGDEGREGETVEFIIFQTVQELNEYSYSTALVINKVAFPGIFGPIHLPDEVSFCVIENVDNLEEVDSGLNTDDDGRRPPNKLKPTLLLPLKIPFKVARWIGNEIIKVSEDAYHDLLDSSSSPQERHISKSYLAPDTHIYEGPSASMQSVRLTGPFEVRFGETALVSHRNLMDVPQVTSKSSNSFQKDSLKVINEKGNVRPLEFALYKKEAKLVSYKDVLPNNEVLFSPVQPAIFIMKRPASHHIQYEFKAVDMMKQATRIELHPSRSHVMIRIYKKWNNELEFEHYSP